MIDPATPAGIQMETALRRRQNALGANNSAIPGGGVAARDDIINQFVGNEAQKMLAAKKHGGETALNDRRLALGEGQLALKTQGLALDQEMQKQQLANARATLDANRKQSRTLSALGGVGLAVNAAGAYNDYKSVQRQAAALDNIYSTAVGAGDANMAAMAQMIKIMQAR